MMAERSKSLRRPALATTLALAFCSRALAGAPTEPAAQAGSRIPVILDTDIGTDIDDTWALVMLLKSPELDLKLVTTDTGNTTYRARIVARLLEIAGRTDVPIGIGIEQNQADDGPQAPWVAGYGLSRYPGRVLQDGVGALVDTIMSSEKPITLIAIGPVPNVAAALAREPRIAERARFVGMHGSLRLGYGGAPEIAAEANVRGDPAACRTVLGARWDVTITPLDTCGLVQLKGEKYARVAASRDPLVQAVMENYRVWWRRCPWCRERHATEPGLPARESSTLFDTVAVYLAFSSDLLAMEDIGVRVTDDGHTLIDDSQKALRCATKWWDLAAFEDLLVQRLAGPVAGE
jgi:inosine-uridine nucleoside N-ribohydrolase